MQNKTERKTVLSDMELRLSLASRINAERLYSNTGYAFIAYFFFFLIYYARV